MAELLGAVASSITIAGLFKACIEAFELIRTAKNHEVDLKKLKLRLDIEKCRLYNWGESMGLTDTSEASESRPIDRFRFLDIVRDILELIIRLFHDSDKIRDKYGCRPCTTLEICESEQVAMFGSLASSFSNFSVRFKPSLQQSNVAKTVTWVIHDRKKFVGLVTEIKELVDSLQGITSPCVSVARQQGNMRRRIVSVDDAETLSLIAEVCAEDHPDVAKVASDRADTISLASTHKHHVLAWTASVEAAREDVQDRQSPDLESLTHAEVLQKYRELRQTLKDSGKSSDLQTPIPAPNLSDPLRSQPQSPALGAGQLHHTYTKPASPYEEAKLIDIETDAIVKRVTSMHRYSAHTESLERQQGKQHWFIGDTSPTTNASFGELDAPRGMLALSHQSMSDLTPRNIYEVRSTRRSSVDQYGFPGNHTRHSSVASDSGQMNQYYGQDNSSSASITDYGSITSEVGSRLLPRPSTGPAPPQSMMVHFTPRTFEKKHKCKVCDKRFTRPSSLRIHMYSHTGEKPFGCPFPDCDRHFSTASNLRRHKKVHRQNGDILEQQEDTSMEIDSGSSSTHK